MKKLWILLAVILLFSTCSSSPNSSSDNDNDNDDDDNEGPITTSEFVMGADLSYVNQILDHGGVYKDDGDEKDPYQIFGDKGTEVVRLRLFHDPQWIKEAYGDQDKQLYHDVEDVALGIQRAKDQGMEVLLDFHYSDTWADPANQEVPDAWAGESFDAVKDSIYQYTYATLSTLNEDGLLPEMVQIGNETNSGMVHPYGEVYGDATWQELGELINSGISAIREIENETGEEIKVMLHIAQPENVSYWFDQITTFGNVDDFEVMGFSYYTPYSDVSLNEISTYVENFRNDYDREVMILETAYPWTFDGADDYNNIFYTESLVGGFPASKQGQRDFMIELVKEVMEGGGSGVFYWEPAWITSDLQDLWGTGSSWENNALFDFEGNAHAGFEYMSYDYEND
ncbi:MAG: glycosyl hydrolase 53 family protein [Gracilimonas sp.]